MRKTVWSAIVASVAALGLIQLIPIDRTNPPIEQDLTATPEITSILRRACYDCHSNETRWPWYSRVAPFSWLVVYDVWEGREEVNFSTWNRYDAQKRAKLIRESWEEVAEGEMPLWFYVPLHPEARLSAGDRDALRAWAEAQPRVSRDHDDDE